MREIHVDTITDAVSEMCISSNCLVAEDIRSAIEKAEKRESNTLGRQVLSTLLSNADIAKEKMIPICQDTGMVVAFVELGQEARVVGGSIEEAINAGVAKGYTEGYLRASVVADPIRRENTKNNTPAVIHYSIVPGDKLKITISPKGFGSENMSALKMLKPSQGLDGVKSFILETVKLAGPNPCPPIIVGVGIGGTMEKAAVMAKQSLLRPVGSRNKDEFWQGVEDDLLKEVNNLDIGPAGFGGLSTALAVHIGVYATHIAGLPVAVNVGCHVTRHSERVL